MCDPGFATEIAHARLPLGAVGPRATRSIVTIHEGVCDFVCHSGRKMGVPVEDERLGIEPELFPPAGYSPLTRRAPPQVETYLGGFSLRSRLNIKFVDLFEDAFLLFG